MKVPTHRIAAWHHALLCGVLLSAGGLAHAQDILTRNRDIRSLTRKQAALQVPVLITGVVVFVQTDSSIVLHDGCEGIYVTGDGYTLFSNQTVVARVGMRLEVRGVTGPGGFAPVVFAKSIRPLGEGPIPPAPKMQLSDLMNGAWDCQRVQIEGVAQRVYPGTEDGVQTRLEVATPGGGFSVFVNNADGLDAERLLDAELRLTGVCFTLFTPRGEFIGVHLRVSTAGDVEILAPGDPDPFAAPRVPEYALRPFQHDGASLHRRHLTGTVILCRPGEFFYVQMRERAVRVNTRSEDALSPGDIIEASGFVEQQGGFAVLTEAVFRRIGKGPLPKPVSVSRTQILSTQSLSVSVLRQEDYDGTRVLMRASLLKIESNKGEEHRLYLDCQNGIVIATLAAQTPEAALRPFILGSRVEVTGVCAVNLSTGWPKLHLPSPESFTLLLQSPDDVHVLDRPSWWTARRLLTALSVSLVLLAFVFLWSWLLRRTVTRQAGRLAAVQRVKRDTEVAFKATTRERNRLAADLHDTLQQDLSAVAFQMEAAMALREQKPVQASDHTRLAQIMLDRCQKDLRLAVWSLRTEVLKDKSFEEALKQLAELTQNTSGVTCVCRTDNEGVRVREFEANHLLMLVQEALTNALKHASPKLISIDAKIGTQALLITIADDGKGFDPEKSPGPQDGHFGLLGIRERVHLLNGALDLRSAPGQGTRIEVKLPLSPETPDA